MMIERWQMTDSERNSQDAKAAHAVYRSFAVDANAAAIQLAVATLKGLLLINGGAAVAMLGFVATVSGQNNHAQGLISQVSAPLIWFAWGVATAVAATGLGYAVMYFEAAHVHSMTFNEEKPYVWNGKSTKRFARVSGVLLIFAILVAVGSLFCFVYGVTHVAQTFAEGVA
jgi:hypothetical protein